MDKGTHSFDATVLCDGKPDEVHRTFVRRVWWEGGMPWYVPSVVASAAVVQKEKDDSGVGAIRQVPGFIHEEIFEAKLGEHIKYRLKRKSL